jgi:hypothetical protein
MDPPVIAIDGRSSPSHAARTPARKDCPGKGGLIDTAPQLSLCFCITSNRTTKFTVWCNGTVRYPPSNTTLVQADLNALKKVLEAR